VKILIDARLLSKGNSSGIEEYTKLLIDNILNIDEVNTYEFFTNGLLKSALPKEWMTKAVVHSWSLPNKIFDVSAKFLNFPKIDSCLKFDLVFSPHFNNLPLKNTPRILTIHDLSFIHHPDFFSKRHKFWHYFQDIKKQINNAQMIIADSDFTKNDLINTLGISEEKIKRIYPGLSDKFKKISPSEIVLEKYKIKKPYLLYLGTIEPRKNVSSVVAAFNILKSGKFKESFKELNLVIAGQRGWLYEDVIKKINSSEHRKNIILTGKVENEDRVDIYNGAAVFVYPSFFEGFGFPSLEAQACGIPVVASNRTSLGELLGSSALLVDPWRVGDLAHAVEEILVNLNWQMYLVSSGFNNIKRFSWKKTAKDLISIFNKFHL